MRAVAVLAVLGFHFHWGSFVQGGFVGVDIFFVISGFLITRNLLDEIRAGFSFRKFYLRRVRRLFPALFVTVGATLIAGTVFSSPEDLKNLAASAVASVFSVSNIYFWTDSGYFDSAAIQKPLLHIWSLSAEEQFYLVWPALLCLTFLLRQNKRLLVLLLIVIVLGVSAAELELRTDPTAAFFLTPFRFNEFALGAICAVLPALVVPRFGRELLSLAGLTLIGVSVSQFTEGTPFPGLSSMIPCLGASLLIYSNGGLITNRLFENPLATYVGRISYSLYLVHWPIAVFVFQVRGANVTGPEKLLMSVASLVLAIGMYRFVEQPFRERTSSLPARIPNAKFTKILAAITVAVLCLSGAIMAGRGWPWRFPAGAIDIAAQVQTEKQARYAQYQKRCPGDRCMTARPGVNVFVFGDSHAPDIFNALVGIHPEYNYVFLANARCPLLAREDYDLLPASGSDRSTCIALNESRLYGDQLRRADIIVVNALYIWYRPEHLQHAIEKIRKRTAAPIVVLGNYLVFDDDFPSMVIRHGRLAMDSYYQARLSNATFAFDADLEALARRMKFTFISKRKAFCHGDSVLDCPIVFDGKLFTYDKHHLSVAAAAALGDVLRKHYAGLFSLSHRRLWLDPAAIDACEKNAVVDVHWNLRELPPASIAEILVRKAEKPWVELAAVQRTGFYPTGPWMEAGAELMLRDKSTSRELAHITAGRLPCASIQ